MNPSKITETILSQRYIGSVIKTVQADDEDPEEDMTMTISQSSKELALEDFRQETAILSKLR